jgi:hypothetical protein
VIERGSSLPGVDTPNELRRENLVPVDRLSVQAPSNLLTPVERRTQPAGDLNQSPLGTALSRLGSAPPAGRPTEDDKLWFVADATNGRRLTPPAGSSLIRPGRPAHSTPTAPHRLCAFTPYATCPLPPQGNQLPMTIEAGETYGT